MDALDADPPIGLLPRFSRQGEKNVVRFAGFQEIMYSYLGVLCTFPPYQAALVQPNSLRGNHVHLEGP